MLLWFIKLFENYFFKVVTVYVSGKILNPAKKSAPGQGISTQQLKNRKVFEP